MLYVVGLTSTKATLAPVRVTASDVAMKLFAGTRTSSPAPIPRILSAINRASVPFPTPTQCFTLQKSAKAFSNELTCAPPIKAVFDMTSAMTESISGWMD